MTNPYKSSVIEDNTEDLSAIVELSEEDTDLVGGGPEVINDPPVN